MSNKLINARELARMYALMGPAKTCKHLSESLAKKYLRPESFSIRDLAESLIKDGSEYVRNLDTRRKSGGLDLMEAANAVDTAAFANITGQIIFNKMKDAFDDDDFIGDECVEIIPTTFLNGEKIPGIGRIGDEAEIVDESMPYPVAGVNEEYIETPATTKRGLIVPVTREAIVADRTAFLLKRASEVGQWLGANREKRILDVVLGVTNNYKRNGSAYNTYQSSTPWINQQAKTLVDWKSVEAAELLLDAITDPNTGEPISLKADTIIVPSALKYTARRILNATSIATVDNQANAATSREFAPSPLDTPYRVLSNRYVKQRTSSASTWFLGSPKKAFAYMEVWPLTVVQAANNSEAEFMQDIVMRYKASERGAAAVIEPRYMTKNT